jgi:2-methylisocitrate lyase-like PEP mutase family enzyme
LSTVPCVTSENRAEAFRALHERQGAFVIPNPWDAGSARILAALGFEALATTSGGLAYSLGRRDGEGMVSRDEALRHAESIVEATPLPVSADLENGFGDDPDAVAETIRQAAGVGLVGGSIEDATTRPDEPIYPIAQAAERVQAAAEAARPVPFVLTARAENYLYGRRDLDDTIARLQAFEAAGADVLYAPGLKDIEEIRQVCAALSKPVNVIAMPGGPDVGELAAAGVRRVSLGSTLYRAAMGGFLRAARELHDQGSFGFMDQAAPGQELNGFMTDPE